MTGKISSLHITDGGENLVVQGEPIVSSDRFYIFTRGSKEVGRISATFDFSELPAEYHQLAVQMIMSDTRRVCLALDPLTEEEKQELVVFKKPWWKKFKLFDFEVG